MNNLSMAEKMQQAFEEIYPKMLAEKMMPMNLISTRWESAAYDALQNISKFNLGISGEQFKSLYSTWSNSEAYNMAQFAWINTAIELCTAKQLELTMDEYTELQVECSRLAEYWNVENKVMREQLEKELEQKIVGEQLKGKTLAKA